MGCSTRPGWRRCAWPTTTRLASLRLADDAVVWLDRDAQLRRWRPPNPAVSRLAWALGVIVLAPGGVFGPALVADPRGRDLAGRVLVAWAEVGSDTGRTQR